MTAPTPPVDATPAPEAAPAAPVPTAPPAPVPTPPPAPPAAPAPEAPPAEGEPQESPDIAKLRREAAKYRTERNEQKTAAEALAAEKAAAEQQAAELRAILEGINKALNPGADEAPDPAKLAEQLAAAQAERESLAAEKDAEINRLRVQAALPSAFARAAADPDLTLAVLTASGVLSQLDPSADSFGADLASAVEAAVEANPKLKNAPVAVRSGAEIPGRSGGSDQVTREQLARMSTAEIEKARVAGHLKNLLSGSG